MEGVEEEVERQVHGYQKWQIVAATAAITLTTLAAKDLVSNREDVYESIKNWVFRTGRSIPAVKRRIAESLDNSRKDLEKSMFEDNGLLSVQPPLKTLPPTGWTREQVLQEASNILREGKYEWRDGKISGGAFSGSDDMFTNLLEKIYGLFAFSNPLHADIFPGVRKMEAEIVRMTISLFHGTDEQCGCITSGGSESILMAMKAMRDWSREVKGVEKPEIVACVTVHAAFDKSASLLGIKIRKVPMDHNTCKVNIAAMRQAITSNTVMLVASAPEFPHGIIDDVEKIGALGQQYDVPVHVDCCMGGFILPFMEGAGYPLPPFDFRVPGVTSISADTHKYGNAPKGSSVIMYRSEKYRHYQYFVVPDWPGGIYASPTIPGSRAGGLVAVCWAALVYHGVDGYTETTRKIITTARHIKKQLKLIPEIQLFGDPLTSIVAFTSTNADIFKVGDILGQHGWHLTFIQYPSGLHICLTSLQNSDDFAERFVTDVKKAITEVGVHPGDSTGLGKVYGTAADIPDKFLIGEAAKVFLTCYYETEPSKDEELEEVNDTEGEETTKGI
ncbi:Sphingosine-1-phosphate lyase-like [Homarus americanus]|uniref:sphinganine-1-phosphate aldolase n=1 Tax=Homarus americanus TaxID=6706 RepID=A0A8J5MUB0_HOMAM|nr:Sphingosine-1-phosphate lyase-like [Homarus americanus]